MLLVQLDIYGQIFSDFIPNLFKIYHRSRCKKMNYKKYEKTLKKKRKSEKTKNKEEKKKRLLRGHLIQ